MENTATIFITASAAFFRSYNSTVMHQAFLSFVLSFQPRDFLQPISFLRHS